MSISVVLASAFVLSFVALLVFIWSQRHGLFSRDSSGARVIFGADEIGRAEEPAVTQPRAYVPGSIMPSYPYLFLIKDQAEPDDVVVLFNTGSGLKYLEALA